MPVFAFDDEWVEIDADDYFAETDVFGTPIIARAQIELEDGRTIYLGILELDTFQYYPHDYDVGDEEDE